MLTSMAFKKNCGRLSWSAKDMFKKTRQGIEHSKNVKQEKNCCHLKAISKAVMSFFKKNE